MAMVGGGDHLVGPFCLIPRASDIPVLPLRGHPGNFLLLEPALQARLQIEGRRKQISTRGNHPGHTCKGGQRGLRVNPDARCQLSLP